jgi:hypothetical protein
MRQTAIEVEPFIKAQARFPTTELARKPSVQPHSPEHDAPICCAMMTSNAVLWDQALRRKKSFGRFETVL